MRAGIIGVGGVGRVLARELCADPSVASVMLMDLRPLPPGQIAALRARGDVEFVRLDASREGALARAVRRCDLVANTSSPALNRGIMRAALDAGADYLDVSATGPRKPGGLPGILEQLGMHEAFARASRTALLSMGLDPGMSNVLARDAADRLDSVEEIRIRSGGTARIRDHGRYPGFVPLYSREAFFSDLRIAPTVWERGRLVEHERLSGEEAYRFPSPVGMQPTFLVAHEEVKTLPLHLGKRVGRVDFKLAIHPDLVAAVRALRNLGVLADRQTVRPGRGEIPFRTAFESAFPEPATVARRIEGTKALSVEVEGTRGGTKQLLRRNIVLSHERAIRRRGTTAVYYLTGVAAAIGMQLLARGDGPAPGVHPAEALNPAKVFREWSRHKLPLSRLERSAPD